MLNHSDHPTLTRQHDLKAMQTMRIRNPSPLKRRRSSVISRGLSGPSDVVHVLCSYVPTSGLFSPAPLVGADPSPFPCVAAAAPQSCEAPPCPPLEKYFAAA